MYKDFTYAGTVQLIRIFLILLVFSGCYVSKQGYEGLKLLSSRQKVAEIIDDPQTKEPVRLQLYKIQEILQYARGEGLNTEDAYEHFIHIDREVVSYLVQAAEPHALKPKTWWFPFVGSVPYKGFFDKLERDELASELRTEGYDVHESGAAAFSSLGWFEDPIFSPMIGRDDADLADLFFHELVHRTYWVEGEVEFNENLAEYLSQVLTIKYLKSKKDVKALEKYLMGKNDKQEYKKWLNELRNSLTELYKNPSDKPINEILEEKKKIFIEFTKNRKPIFKNLDFIGKKEWNNARVLAASLYSPDMEKFSKSLECAKVEKVGEYLKKLDQLIENDVKINQVLDKLCDSV